ncbi:S-layer homology domain-containing protein [Lentibacillus sp. Marseille-P4043]|uniref:S-layer homology domain-containing protein n=1 Tax=Lentibacillus sp. Marseille-P4043 TaxID=2040293 RepID=UPI000D0AD95F|nr:S-layer homology domain-containing protein [Lentibacillus sp. Marseille-P4043]
MSNNKAYRKIAVSSMATAAAVAGIAPAVSAAEFDGYSDVDSSNSHYEGIKSLTEQGVIKGYEDGSFGVWDNVTRQQVAVMLAGALDLDTPTDVAGVLSAYDDVDEDSLYAEQIAAVTAADVFSGDNGQFNPDGDITREQMASVLVLAYGLDKYDVPDVDVNLDGVGDSHADRVQALANLDITNQLEDYRSEEGITRGSFSTMLHEAQKIVAPANVESVSAINPTTLSLSGIGLLNLDADQITVEGNEVVSLNPSNDGQSATVTLDDKLAPYKEYTVSVTVDGETEEFTVEFTPLDVKNVEVTTTVIDDDKDGQRLGFSVNGEGVDLDYLTNVLGWSVEFQADKDVFENGATTPVSTSESGEISDEDVEINDTFNAKVVLTKDGTTVESDYVEVKVVNDNETPAIGSVALENDNNAAGDNAFDMNSTTLVTGETAKVTGINSSSGDVIDITGSRSYSSSDNRVVTVDNATDEIKAVAPGTATVTVTAGLQTYEIDVTVTNEERVVSNIVPSKSEVKVAPGVNATVDVTAYDQYGDPIQTNDNEVEEASDLTVPELNTDKNGEASLTIDLTGTNAVDPGTYPVYLKANGIVLGQYDVVVTEDNVANTPKIEGADTVAVGENIDLTANLYTKSGGFVESLEATNASGALKDNKGNTYTVESVDKNVATVATSLGSSALTVTGVTEGSTEFVLKDENDNQVAKYVVNVTNDTIQITSVDWLVDGDTITNQDVDIDLYDALEIEDVTDDSGNNVDSIVRSLSLNVDTTAKVRVEDISTNEATFYVDFDDDGSNNNDDVVVGTVEVTEDPNSNFTASNLDSILTTDVGDEGSLIFTISDDDSGDVLSSTTLNVNVK